MYLSQVAKCYINNNINNTQVLGPNTIMDRFKVATFIYIMAGWPQVIGDIRRWDRNNGSYFRMVMTQNKQLSQC